MMIKPVQTKSLDYIPCINLDTLYLDKGDTTFYQVYNKHVFELIQIKKHDDFLVGVRTDGTYIIIDG